jgi:hypothetical protein
MAGGTTWTRKTCLVLHTFSETACTLSAFTLSPYSAGLLFSDHGLKTEDLTIMPFVEGIEVRL